MPRPSRSLASIRRALGVLVEVTVVLSIRVYRGAVAELVRANKRPLIDRSVSTVTLRFAVIEQ
jgi:hypothetical protein